MDTLKRTLIGHCTVDSGMLMIGDPCYFVGEDAPIHEKCESWTQACIEIFSKNGEAVNVYGLGVAVQTTHGDGNFPVYLETDENGKRRLVVNLQD